MERARRYPLAAAVAVAVTGGVAALTPAPDRSLLLLLGVALVYLVGTAVALGNVEALTTSGGPNWTGGAFTGVLTFGCVSLLIGTPHGPNVAVTALAFGLGTFGLVAGIAIERER